ncbi:hypothetical protein, partial [Bathymodiolus platifrons methanotrophic gill symbiont]|uniref:hypothetical protein n=1 Tax=Bathymodiolus platifrons methanotrophic gill symbiont TaxID=113268 RepID=UPI001B7D8F24
NSIAPYKEIKIKQNSEPWMTSEILGNIRKRDQYLISYKKKQVVNIYIWITVNCEIWYKEM